MSCTSYPTLAQSIDPSVFGVTYMVAAHHVPGDGVVLITNADVDPGNRGTFWCAVIFCWYLP
jgi:hypothetical protein